MYLVLLSVSFTMRKILLVCWAILIITGCASIGPRRVQIDRGTYNNIVRETDQEQVLTNIVRQRYLEITEYIQVASLTASYSLSQSLSGSVSALTSTGPASLTSSLSPTVTYSDTPTISYIPLSNIEFAKSLMTPVTMDNFLLLAHAGGYDHTTLFSLLFEQIGDVDGDLLNQNGLSRLTPEYVKFNRIMDLFNKMYRNGVFNAPRAVSYEKHLGIMIRFKQHNESTPEALKLQKLLGIPTHSKYILFMEHTLLEALKEKNGLLVLEDTSPKFHNVVFVRLRSVYSIIHLLGRGVQIPFRDISAHMTRELINPDGSRFDWANKMRNILTVYSSDEAPRSDYLVKVNVHHHWFYIKSSDQASKDTFDAIIRLLTLTSSFAANNNSIPILTIPVASSVK